MGDFWDTMGGTEADEEEFLADRETMEAKFAEYDKLCVKLMEWAGGLRDAEARAKWMDSLRKLRYRLMQGPVRLLVLGASSAGKSTLVNALAGRVVSPEGEWCSTCIPAWVQGVDAMKLEGPVYYAMRYGDPNETYRTREQYLIYFCHPPGEQKEEDYYAVRAKVRGGFLAESGITLLDTPGVGQQEKDTQMTMLTASLGAELLLLAIRNNVFNPQEVELYRELFPGGKFDLGLEPSDEVFCLFNRRPLDGEMPSNVAASFQSLAANGTEQAGQVDIEGRLYCVDVLEERKKYEAYRYFHWAPDGITEETAETLRRLQDTEVNGDREYGALMGHRQLADCPPGEEMQRLRDDLKLQARVWYADPDRLCRPIERTLREAAEALLADCRRRMDEENRKIEAEMEALRAEDLDSPELTRLRREFGELMDFTNRANKRTAELRERMDKLQKDAAGAVSALRSSAQSLAGEAARQFQNELLNNISWGDSVLTGSSWHNDIVSDVCRRFAEHDRTWRQRIHTQQLMLGSCKSWIDWNVLKERIQKCLEDYNKLADGVRQYAPGSAPAGYDAKSEAFHVLSALTQDAAFDGWEKPKEIDQAAQEVEETITAYRNNRPGGEGVFVSIRREWSRVSAASNAQIKAAAQLKVVLLRDLNSFLDRADLHTQELEARYFAPMKERLSGMMTGLIQPRMELVEKLMAEEKLVRSNHQRDAVIQRVAPLDREKQELEALIRALPLSGEGRDSQ